MRLWQILSLIVFIIVVVTAVGLLVAHFRTPHEKRSGLPEHDLLDQAWTVLWAGGALSIPAGLFLAYSYDWFISDLIPAIQRGIENAP